MKNNSIIIFLLIILFASVTINFAQEEGQMSEEQKVWMDYMTPGDMHKMLEKGVGNWNVTTKWWMAPETEPMISDGKVVGEMILGGRYLRSKHTGTAMGMPFEGISIEGYDNTAKIFTSVWIDNMGTGIATAKGKYDKESKTINYTGTMMDPMKGEFSDFRQTFKIVGDDETVFEMFYKDEGGNEFKMMEMVSKRGM